MTTFRHLDYPAGSPVSSLGPAGLDALLDRGDLADWEPLARAIKDDPFGQLADTVLRLCASHPMYGTSALWTTWISGLRSMPPEITLREVRKRARMTQAEVGKRMGRTQSDVSKLERRSDLRLSTLREYFHALGYELRLVGGWPPAFVLKLDDPRHPR